MGCHPQSLGCPDISAALKLMHTLHLDPGGQHATLAFLDSLRTEGHDHLASEGHQTIRNVIAGHKRAITQDLQDWLMKLVSHTQRGTRAKISATTHNLGPSGISVSMDVIADTLAMGPYIACFQDILIHGQNTRGVKRAIEEINPNYHIFLATGSFAPDDHRKTNYGGWRASGMACLTLLHKRAFDTLRCAKFEWRNPKDRRANTSASERDGPLHFAGGL